MQRFDIEPLYTLIVHGLQVNVIIGIRPHERLEKQPILLDLRLEVQLNYKEDFIAKLIRFVEASSYQTVEALCWSITNIMIHECNFKSAQVKVIKPRVRHNMRVGCSTVIKQISE